MALKKSLSSYIMKMKYIFLDIDSKLKTIDLSLEAEEEYLVLELEEKIIISFRGVIVLFR